MATRVSRGVFILTDYTQAEEDTLALQLAGLSAGSRVIFNTDISPSPGVPRIWNGTAFENVPPDLNVLVPLATSTLQGGVPAFGSPLQVMRVNSAGNGLEFVDMAGGGGVQQITKNLGTDLTSSSVTMVKVTDLDQVVGVGTWIFEYHVMWQTTTTATAIKLGVNHSGTVTRFVVEATGFEATTAAATGAQDATHTAFGLRSGGQNNAVSTSTSIFGPTSVTAADQDHYTVIRGLIVVSVSGNLELYFGSEATGSTQTLEFPTSLILTRII